MSSPNLPPVVVPAIVLLNFNATLLIDKSEFDGIVNLTIAPEFADWEFCGRILK
jgi:hypothetical protein